MLEIRKTSKFLQLVYSYGDPTFNQDDWIKRELNEKGLVRIKRGIFTLTPNLVSNPARLEINHKEFVHEYENFSDIIFNIGSLITLTDGDFRDDYYKIHDNVLIKGQDIYLHKDLDIETNFFIAETNISVFGQIAELASENLIIGGNLPNCIPAEEFYTLIKNFPTTYEKKLYAQARISTVLRNYFDSTKDAETLFVKYRNKSLL